MSDWRDMEYVGTPIPAMAERVKRWLSEGRDVRIFTARVAPPIERLQAQKAQWAIEDWCVHHFGEVLPVTAVKDFGIGVLYDDRCIPVEPGTGCPMIDEIWLQDRIFVTLGRSLATDEGGVALLHTQADVREADKCFWKRFISPICYLLARNFRALHLNLGRSR